MNPVTINCVYFRIGQNSELINSVWIWIELDRSTGPNPRWICWVELNCSSPLVHINVNVFVHKAHKTFKHQIFCNLSNSFAMSTIKFVLKWCLLWEFLWISLNFHSIVVKLKFNKNSEINSEFKSRSQIYSWIVHNLIIINIYWKVLCEQQVFCSVQVMIKYILLFYLNVQL